MWCARIRSIPICCSWAPTSACYVSTDDGANWQRFMSDLPTVPVFDLKIHPRDHELIAATHGRSIWIVDINPLEQMTAENLAAPLTVFKTGDRVPVR